MKKEYSEPAIEVVKFSFESILAKVDTSDPEGSLPEQGGTMPDLGDGEDPFANMQ